MKTYERIEPAIDDKDIIHWFEGNTNGFVIEGQTRTRQVQTGTETIEIEPAILDEEGGELTPAKTEERPVFETEEYSPYEELLKEAEAAGAEIAPYERPRAEIEAEAKAEAQRRKLEGVEFEGVMCSAHKDDQYGLASLKPYVLAGKSLPFEFKNGNKLMLTPDNIEAFESVWFPFRLSFFTEGE